MWWEWNDGAMTLAVFMAPLFPCVLIGGFLYPKQCLGGVAVTVAAVVGWKLLVRSLSNDFDTELRSQ